MPLHADVLTAERSEQALTALRIACGVFFIPHALGKVLAREAAIGFLTRAGFRPAGVFLMLALGIELALAALLVTGLAAPLPAWFGCLYLLVAAGAVIKVQKAWLWHVGGCEYAVFWAVCCGLSAYASKPINL